MPIPLSSNASVALNENMQDTTDGIACIMINVMRVPLPTVLRGNAINAQTGQFQIHEIVTIVILAVQANLPKTTIQFVCPEK